jgi:hypothetical protein
VKRLLTAIAVITALSMLSAPSAEAATAYNRDARP